MSYSKDEARAELARRELAKRGIGKKEDQPPEESYGRDILSGLAEGGHQLLNSPYELVKALAQQGQEFGNSINKTFPIEKYIGNQEKKQNPEEDYADRFNREHNVPESIKNPDYKKGIIENIPHQKEYNFAEMLGQKEEPSLSHKLVQGLAQYAPELIGGAAAYRELPIALTRRGAARELRLNQHLANERGVNNLNIPEHLIEDARQFLPTTRPYQNLLEEAQHGGYNPFFALQSDLGRAGAGFSRSPFSFAERRHGREALRTRESLINHVTQELENQGHLDMSELLRQGQRRYRNYQRLRHVRNAALTIGSAQTPYGKKLLKALGITD